MDLEDLEEVADLEDLERVVNLEDVGDPKDVAVPTSCVSTGSHQDWYNKTPCSGIGGYLRLVPRPTSIENIVVLTPYTWLHCCSFQPHHILHLPFWS